MLNEKSKPSLNLATANHVIAAPTAIRLPRSNGSTYKHSDDNVHELQFKLIEEEFSELRDEYFVELDLETPVNQLKELADLVFVCYQYATARGWNLDAAMRRVFDSNMKQTCRRKAYLSRRWQSRKRP